jgi:hypothetical protein
MGYTKCREFLVWQIMLATEEELGSMEFVKRFSSVPPDK